MNKQKKKRKNQDKNFTVPKVKVSKESFDKVLGSLIQAKPQPEKRLK
jgi:hypothetical protein